MILSRKLVTFFTLTSLAFTAQYNTKEMDTLFNMSLEELMNVSIESVSRKETKAFESDSSVYILNSDDIEKSGATSISELLYLIPGVNVGRLDSNMYAVDTRGINKRFSEELLVMIDGRTLYTPLFNGVIWSNVDTLLEDIERIEVIRGPGASLWGKQCFSWDY
jgi:iron complex outermembrane recepter protein